MLFLSISIYIVKCSNPKSPLPDFDYKGMTKEEVVMCGVTNVLIDSKSNGILMAAPPGCYIRVKNADSILKNGYAMQQSVWDVNIIYTQNHIKGGYYYYRLKFDKKGRVAKQMKLFASEGLFGLYIPCM